MNREERRALATRVRRGIASPKEQAIFGLLGGTRGEGPGKSHWMADVLAELRGMLRVSDFPNVAQYRRYMNARKATRRARAGK